MITTTTKHYLLVCLSVHNKGSIFSLPPNLIILFLECSISYIVSGKVWRILKTITLEIYFYITKCAELTSLLILQGPCFRFKTFPGSKTFGEGGTSGGLRRGGTSRGWGEEAHHGGEEGSMAQYFNSWINYFA